MHRALTAVFALIAVVSCLGWYSERQWKPEHDPAELADNQCTIEGDAWLTYEFMHGYGDLVTVRVVPERDRVVVGYRTESRDGIRAVGATSRYSVLLPSGLRGRPVVYEDGTRVRCTAVD